MDLAEDETVPEGVFVVPSFVELLELCLSRATEKGAYGIWLGALAGRRSKVIVNTPLIPGALRLCWKGKAVSDKTPELFQEKKRRTRTTMYILFKTRGTEGNIVGRRT